MPEESEKLPITKTAIIDECGKRLSDCLQGIFSNFWEGLEPYRYGHREIVENSIFE